ncbi:MAG: 50S ribosomal protein L18e [Candidatus Diapherotrites archaeon]|nr:50S ribosomal protein L18e [Candidatus Diapherotrites archaeon]
MKKTGPTKESTRKLAIFLEKIAKKRGKRIWKILAESLMKQRRKKGEINIWKINKLSTKFRDKILVTTQKVLASGTLNNKVIIAAPAYSKTAKQKIEKAGGKIINYKELAENNYKERDMILIK